MNIIKVPASKPRNMFTLHAIKRSAGKHQKSHKTERQQSKKDIRSSLDDSRYIDYIYSI
jgi:hypothetical protein